MRSSLFWDVTQRCVASHKRNTSHGVLFSCGVMLHIVTFPPLQHLTPYFDDLQHNFLKELHHLYNKSCKKIKQLSISLGRLCNCHWNSWRIAWREENSKDPVFIDITTNLCGLLVTQRHILNLYCMRNNPDGLPANYSSNTNRSSLKAWAVTYKMCLQQTPLTQHQLKHTHKQKIMQN
jgi:hypothetical protein